ncbi:uncharacterized protein EAE98_010115 [Botrytis deweyae]|uniref:Utp8 beta-propeller domain-containing protein n=1 Tax=Botrytis deweyae TaxID=2478750 RepID=A0ABQ7I9S3_9HELO|nr:uncharacterized protein EAE98_010115 [Botrytis deweyae]KAF7917699.1 hypothetical protein EAE98_010115 [Botrytis deweyae]
MSSRISLQQPYVVATLPRSKQAQYVVGEVFGGSPGSKKRKRSELAVGIHGEGVNLYDVSSSKLLTSYALPPGTSFSCPPYSSRSKTTKTKTERRTYVSTSGSEDQITLFHDITEGTSTSQSTTVTHKLSQSKAPVVHLGALAASGLDAIKKSDILIVKKDGEIQCLDGESLQLLWSSPATALGRASSMTMTNIEVEYAHITNAYSAGQGILKGRQDVFAFFPQEVTEDGFNPDIIIVITKSNVQEAEDSVRTLHIVALPRKTTTYLNGTTHSVESLLDAPLPIHKAPKKKVTVGKASFGINVSAGVLQILEAEVLTTLDLHDTFPKIQSEINTPGTGSFLRLSSTSIIMSNQQAISILNPKYESVLATIKLDDEANKESLKRKRDSDDKQRPRLDIPAQFISYYPKLGAALAISDNELVAVQVDFQPGQGSKSRAFGLLIDSLGCSDPQVVRSKPGKEPSHGKWLFVDHYLPGSMGMKEDAWVNVTREPERCVKSGDTAAFEKALGSKFDQDWSTETSENPADKIAKIEPSEVDRRWILYALSKIFSWSQNLEGVCELSIIFYPPRLFRWLLQTGNMTILNIESALRQEIRASLSGPIPAGQLVNAIVKLDREMELLLHLVSSNLLGAAELLHAIRKLMETMDLFELGDSSSPKQALLTNGEDTPLENDNAEEEVQRLEAEAEDDLQLAEFQLGEGSGVRGEALNVALSKLYTCPDNNITEALQTTFTSQETVSLIYILRVELAKGGWTGRYLDILELDDDEVEAPDNSIILISSLLNNCIDALAAGGWLTGNARLINGDQTESEAFIGTLKMEVSAALEGIETAVYLKGLTSEMVRYGDSVLKTLGNEDTGRMAKSILTLPSGEKDLSTLPIGLKAEKQISRLRVGAGGEIQKRSKRDIGRLLSRQVGKYTRERIVL